MSNNFLHIDDIRRDNPDELKRCLCLIYNVALGLRKDPDPELLDAKDYVIGNNLDMEV